MKTSLQHALFLAALLALTARMTQAAGITVDAGGICTLAVAITAANTDTAAGGCPAGSGADTITLQTDVSLAAALPQISSPVTIEGQGHRIDGNQGGWAVLTVASSGSLTLNKAAVTGGYNNTSGLGGGLCNLGGTVMLTRSTVSGNGAHRYGANYGGGIYNGGGALTLINSTVSGNAAYFSIQSIGTGDGGGIYNASGGAVTLIHSTVSGNLAYSSGGGVASAGALTLRSALISGNTAASADGNEVSKSGGTLTADSSNVFGDSGESNADAFSGFTPGSKDRTATSDGAKPTTLAALLSPLADNGGPTKTHALLIGSPALDADPTCSTGLTEDQRSGHRPVGTGCDAGSFELKPDIVVDAGGGCTLAAAITAANTDTAAGGCPAGYDADTIILKTDVALAAALPEISSAVTIKGQGHTIDGKQGNWSVLTVAGSGNLILNRATLTGGKPSGSGGGLANAGAAALSNVTVSGNTAGQDGGGVHSSGSLTLTNVTVSANEAGQGGGLASAGALTLRSSLISGNTAASSGNEVYVSSGAATADSANLFGHDGESTAQAFSGFTPGSKDAVVTGDGAHPAALAAILSPLAANNGAKTHALPTGSPALDLDAACSAGLSMDQRGWPRSTSIDCDAGSYERSAAMPWLKLLLKRN